ncbi:MAG: hypothetical protein LBQ66_12725 [Planctomycetaceae bacterium]|jgi:hypothetical protein|nr:hypothetical protein [Planctomycetaceae bacterium]
MMFFKTLFSLLFVAVIGTFFWVSESNAQQGYRYQRADSYYVQDWQRFQYYPYVYYPHNFYSQEYFRGNGDIYNRYPPEMQVPAYNKDWFNFYPEPRKYHSGHHFRLSGL